jgi:GNAT superfamily N-acetyltransferase
MINVQLIDTYSKEHVKNFVQFPFSLYADCLQWVPPFRSDIRVMLDRGKHPLYERSDADFIVAERDGKTVGQMAVFEHKPFNKHHNKNQAQFTLFDCVNDQDVANALFEAGYEWARKRGLDRVVGPKGFCSFDGYGILIKGFEHDQMMTMVPYNYDYYPELLEGAGFRKEVDFISFHLDQEKMTLTEKAAEVARRVRERKYMEIKEFTSKREFKTYLQRFGNLYNSTFIHNWEYYPLSEKEVQFLLDSLIAVIDPRLVKFIMKKDEIIGFILAFPDLTPQLKRANGRLTPWALLDLLFGLKRAKSVALNGAAVLPEYYGRGGNALLYSEIEKTIKDYGYEHAEMIQIADTAVQMRKDMAALGAEPYKTYRVYGRDI